MKTAKFQIFQVVWITFFSTFLAWLGLTQTGKLLISNTTEVVKTREEVSSNTVEVIKTREALSEIIYSSSDKVVMAIEGLGKPTFPAKEDTTNDNLFLVSKDGLK